MLLGVPDEGSRESCDSQCRKLTASWVREAKVNNPNIETCDFYEGLDAAGAEGVMDPGVCVPSSPCPHPWPCSRPCGRTACPASS